MDLRADCARCDGLCCVAFAFERSSQFGVDKPAGQACLHLSSDNRCAIHADRAAHGFAGCEVYECHGAGQAATALFQGLSWRHSESVGRHMLDAFARLRRLHSAAKQLELLATLDLPVAIEQQRVALAARCAESADWNYADLLMRSDTVIAEVAAWLVKLRGLPALTLPHEIASAAS